MNETYQSGTVEVAVGTGVISPDRLGDVTVAYTEGTRTGEPLSGTVTIPSRRFEERTITFTMFLRSIDELGTLWPEYYNAAAGASGGNLVFSTGNCTVPGLQTINIHPVCEPNSTKDFHAWGNVSITWNPTYNASDLLQTEVTIYGQSNDQGVSHQIGSGDLTQDTLWSASTQTWVPVGSS